jgi:hypothetical protein
MIGAFAQDMVEYKVTRHGADATHVRALERLGIKAELSKDGGLRFVDASRFLAVPTRDLGVGPANEDGPTRLMSVDFSSLKNIKLPASATAIQAVGQALKDAGVDTQGAQAYAFNSTVDLLEGESKQSYPIDTTVGHRFALGGIRLVGPGAKMRFALDSGSALTHAHIATRQLAPGSSAKLISADELRKIEAERFGVNAKLKSEVVYYAPPMEVRAQRIVPHRLYTGSVTMDGQTVSIRPAFVPLVADAPRASMEVNGSGSQLEAVVKVSGGRAPYQFSLSSPAAAAKISGASATFVFTAETREKESQNLVSVTVTDADGLVSVATAPVPQKSASSARAFQFAGAQWGTRLATAVLAQPDTSRFASRSIGLHAVGQSYVGSPLGMTIGNADGLRDRASAASISVPFFWREGLAFERDWKSPSFRGNSDRWFDQVDLGFFSGHAGGGGWMYSSAVDDGWVGTNEVRLGSGDAEWAVIAACGPLQPRSDAQNRGVFQGLHMLCGYASNSFDTDREGRVFGDLILHKSTFLWMTLRDYQPIRTAWINTAIEIQPAEESPGVPILVGAMGVRRSSDGVSSWNDHFHGFGPVSPDIPASTARSFWVVRTGT